MGPSELKDRAIGKVTVLFGVDGGKYPSGNSLLVRGSEETILIDPSLAVIPRHGTLSAVDRVLLSHCHEDHLAGAYLFPEVPCHLHGLDLPGIRTLEGFEAIYGLPEPIASQWRKALLERFHFVPRPDALAFSDGDVFELGGARIEVIHAPGHTRGHSLFSIQPDDVLYLGDIDLSGFGPYYGDAWSDLESFERTLERVRAVRARWYATFHHIGVLEGREPFLERLERFASSIQNRETRLLEFLKEPHTLDEVVAHRFIYRPSQTGVIVDPVERRSMGQHVERLIGRDRVREVEPGRFQALAS
ncbi:MAG: MBL fold metallo-hydrolase [Myxococcota bacterium]